MVIKCTRCNTRNVVGLADEIRTDEPVYSSSTNYYTSNPEYLLGVVNGVYDSEYDIFNFNFNGRSGKFIIKQDGGIFQIPNSDLKITYVSGLSSFTITDESGITYLFDQIETTTSQTYPISTYTNDKSAWYLSRVEMPDKNNIIQFTYTSAGYSTQLFNSFSQAIGAKFTPTEANPVLSSLNTRSSTTNSTNTSMLKLSSINFPNGSLIFTYDATARLDIGAGNNITNKLTAVTINQVINSVSNQIKKINLYQSYFFYHVGGGSNTPNDYRLRLDSLAEYGASTATSPKKYRFEYNTTSIAPRGNFGQDIWGFNNGQFSNPSLLQSQSVDFTDGFNVITYAIGDANRNTDTNQMKACILTAVNWPTGGKTAFTYEAHVYNAGQNIVTTTEQETHVFGDHAAPQVSTTTFTFPTPTVAEFPRVITNMSRYDFPGVYLQPYVTVKDLTIGVEIYHLSHMNPSQTLSHDEPIYLVGGHNYELKAYVFSTDTTNYQLTASIKIKWGNNTFQPDIKKGGGLRIKEIKNYSGNGKLAGTESYIYDTATTLNPVNIISRTYSEVIYRLGFGTGASCIVNLSPVCRVYQSGSVYPVSTAMGSPMLYRNVQKITTDSITGAINGKSEYNYDVVLDEWSPGSGSYKMIPFVSNDWKNGFLTSETNYKFKNGIYSIVKKTENKYSEYKASTIYGLRIEATAIFEGCRLTEPASEAAGYDAVYYLYPYRTGSKKLTETIETLYDDNQNKIEAHSYSDYLSSKNDFVTKQTVIDSKGNQDSVTYKYPSDFSSSGNVYEKMEQQNIIAPVIEQKSYSGATLINTVKTNYRDWMNNGKIISPDSIQASVLNNALETRIRYYAYDANNNPLSVSKSKDAVSSYIWGYNNSYPVAEVINADIDLIAYTSFEGEGNGGWSGITAASYTNNGSVTGIKAYTQNNFSISRSYTPVAGTYIVSYWSKNGAYYVNGSTATSLRTINGWTLYEHKVTIYAYQGITVSGSGSIDELRLYPQGALMKTYTYDLLIGVTSQCDVNNHIVYYTYDDASRLVLIRDENKNIFKEICYNYSGQAENCSIYYNTQQSGNFTRNNCQSGFTGSTVTYTVPANTYSSAISVTDANNKAIADKNANGQNYANENGTCTAPMVTVNCHNYDFSTPFTIYFNSYSIYLSPSGSGSLQIPAGSYTVYFSQYGSNPNYFSVAGYTSYGVTATFYNVSITSTTNANIGY